MTIKYVNEQHTSKMQQQVNTGKQIEFWNKNLVPVITLKLQ